MEDLLPVLVSRLPRANAAVPEIEAALRGAIAFVKLVEGPTVDGPHALELHAPDWNQPLVLLAVPEGQPVGKNYPLRLRPLVEEDMLALVAILAENGINYEAPRPARPASVRPARRVREPSSPPPAEPVEIDLGEVEIPIAPPPEDPPAQAPGALLGRVLGGGKYHIDVHLGSGGMGNVYRARHLMLDKAVAVKVVHPSHRHDAELLAAFQREALAASRLDHPNVVRVLDFGREPDGLFYITMELLEGRPLRDVLEQQPVQPLGRIVDVVSQVAAALSHSHDQGVIHRDVKPENVFLVPRRDDDGTLRDAVKVLDFGIAEILGRGEGQGPRAMVTGTPDYMAPEQIHGHPVDVRADLYALGVILFEMATGKVPFYTATTPDRIAELQVSREPPRPSSLAPGLDPRLEATILKALAKDPTRRHQTARELRAELRALTEPLRSTVTPAGTPRPSGTFAAPSLPGAPQSFAGLPGAPQSFAGLPGSPPPRVKPAAGIRPPGDDEDDFLPKNAPAKVSRGDAIDIGDMFGGGGAGKAAGGGGGNGEALTWAFPDNLAADLTANPLGTLSRIEAAKSPGTFLRDMSMLESALALILQRGGPFGQLAVIVGRLAGDAGSTPPGTGSPPAVAAKVLQAISRPELLSRLADEALDAPPADREPARRVLITLGAAGANALLDARERARAKGPNWPGRPRFVAALRELGGTPAGAGVTLQALSVYLPHADLRDTTLIEDVLRALPDVQDERLGSQIASRELRHEAPAVRRAAVTALAALWGPRANSWCAPLVEDPDDGVRIAAVNALRRHGGVDKDLLPRLYRVLSHGGAAGAEAKVAAASALMDAAGPIRGSAAAMLTQVLTPTASGFFQRMVSGEVREDDTVVLTMARVLLAIGGPDAAKTVQSRAARSSGDLRQKLLDLASGR